MSVEDARVNACSGHFGPCEGAPYHVADDGVNGIKNWLPRILGGNGPRTLSDEEGAAVLSALRYTEEEVTTLLDWAEQIKRWGEFKGWDTSTRPQSEWIALSHSELSEALEHDRDGREPDEWFFEEDKKGNPKPDGPPVEHADVLIRELHWFAAHGLDPDFFVALKMAYNEGREHKHGRKY